jgi:phosphoribosyl 1,2-cyclic phosphodiesterase
MKLHVLGSSSAGNGYILEAESSALLIEAGLPYREAMKALNFAASKVAGMIISHSHGDHGGRAKEYAKRGINIYSSLACLEETGVISAAPHRAKPIVPERKYTIGEFKVLPFELVHDVKNYGYLIEHPEMGLICFLTDTHYSPFVFDGLNNIIVECNYNDVILNERVESGSLHPSLAKRIQSSHMAQSTMLDFLRANDLSAVNNIVVIHLSQGNSNQYSIIRDIRSLTGKVPVIAEPGLSIEFNKLPF